MPANTELVVSFCKAWANRDVEEIMSYFAEDAVYHNIPVVPMKGKAAIQAVITAFMAPATAVDWEVLGVAESGNAVFTERVDRFEIAGKKVELPVAGVFEVEDGKISAWRDYFDMATWTRQTTSS
jgi:limonene-1,2-epoxide hydrolase